MIVYLLQEPELVVVQAVARGKGVLGDMIREVREGDDFFGHTYDELKELGEGEVTLADKAD